MFLLIKLFLYIGALILGIIISVLWTPEPTIILSYPTPYNTRKDKLVML